MSSDVRGAFGAFSSPSFNIFLSDSGNNAPALKRVEVICSVPCRTLLTPSYYHSFGMTDNYFVFIEQPFKLDIVKMATAYMRGVNWASCLKFSPEENVRKNLRLLYCEMSCKRKKKTPEFSSFYVN